MRVSSGARTAGLCGALCVPGREQTLQRSPEAASGHERGGQLHVSGRWKMTGTSGLTGTYPPGHVGDPPGKALGNSESVATGAWPADLGLS